MGWPPLQGRARGRGSGARDRVALRRAATGRDPLRRRLARRHRRADRRVGRDPARPDPRRGQRGARGPPDGDRRRTGRRPHPARSGGRAGDGLGPLRAAACGQGRRDALDRACGRRCVAGAAYPAPTRGRRGQPRIRRDRERPPAHRGRVPAWTYRGRPRRRLPGRDALDALRARGGSGRSTPGDGAAGRGRQDGAGGLAVRGRLA